MIYKQENPKTWNPTDMYQEYVKQLLKDNPAISQSVVTMRKDGIRDGKQRFKAVTRQIMVGGYWGKFNRTCNVNNYWVYTMVKHSNGASKIVEVINYARWRKVMETYFLSARRYIILGEALNMGNKLGYIEGRNIERNPSNRQVNFGETGRQSKVWDDELGRYRPRQIIYFDDTDYVRIAWTKLSRITNEKSYEFRPSAQNDEAKDGFKDTFSRANIENPTLRSNYPWFPYIKTAQA